MRKATYMFHTCDNRAKIRIHEDSTSFLVSLCLSFFSPPRWQPRSIRLEALQCPDHLIPSFGLGLLYPACLLVDYSSCGDLDWQGLFLSSSRINQLSSHLRGFKGKEQRKLSDLNKRCWRGPYQQLLALVTFESPVEPCRLATAALCKPWLAEAGSPSSFCRA